MTLKPHQVVAVKAVRQAIAQGTRAGLLSMPTGTGKTFTFAALASGLNWPTLVLVHRVELVEQAEREFRKVWPGARLGIVHAQRDEWQDREVVIAMVPTLHARRLDQMPRSLFRLVVVDEAHHAIADTWNRVLDHFDADFILGVTATPERGDGRGLAARFGERPLYSYGLRQAILDGQLVRLRQYAVTTQVSLDGVAYRAGDFSDSDLSHAVNTPARNKIVVRAFHEHAGNRRAVVFCADVAHAEAMAKAFQAAGIPAGTVTGADGAQLRRDRLHDFAIGRIQVMTNCAVLTEGFDMPAIDAVLMARPTTSRALYTQCVGRGLRLLPGKTDCVVLDFADNSYRHKLVTAMDLLGAVHSGNAEGRDVIEAADEDRIEAERKKLIETTHPLSWRLEDVCPWPEMPSLAGYSPTAWWHRQGATPKQVAYLRSFGVDIGRNLTKGECSYLIDRAAEYEAANPIPATEKQANYLKRIGVWQDGMSKREAQREISRIRGSQLVRAT